MGKWWEDLYCIRCGHVWEGTKTTYTSEYGGNSNDYIVYKCAKCKQELVCFDNCIPAPSEILAGRVARLLRKQQG